MRYALILMLLSGCYYNPYWAYQRPYQPTWYVVIPEAKEDSPSKTYHIDRRIPPLTPPTVQARAGVRPRRALDRQTRPPKVTIPAHPTPNQSYEEMQRRMERFDIYSALDFEETLKAVEEEKKRRARKAKEEALKRQREVF